MKFQSWVAATFFFQIIFSFALISIAPHAVQAQLQPNDLAHVMVDIRLDQLKAFSAKLGNDISTENQRNLPPEARALQIIDRVSGAFELPSDDETTQVILKIIRLNSDSNRRPEPPPSEAEISHLKSLNYYFRITFRDASGKSEFIQMIGMERVSNKEWRLPIPGPPGQGEFSEVVGRELDEKTLELGSRKYIEHANRNFGTDALKAMWKKSAPQAIRLIADLKPAQNFISALIDDANQSAPPMAQPFLSLVKIPERMRLGIDPDQGPVLLSLELDCPDDAGAEELHSGLDSIYGMGKLAAGQMITQLSPEGANLAKKILAELQPKRSGNLVSISFRKPENYMEIVSNISNAMREEAEKVNLLNDYRMIAISMHNYHDANLQFPNEKPAREGAPRPPSWRVQLLNYLELNDLASSYRTDEDWDSPGNRMLATKMPKNYGRDGKLARVCRITRNGETPKSFEEITDGTSKTIMLIENPAGVPWMQPIDIELEDAVKLITGLKANEELIVVFYDGTVQKMRAGVSAEVARGFLTWDGGED